ncbi:hypothetical protein S40285_05918 [Stachybotrys chlorohalonatus IBT 40285]|uniref:DNA/RNA-binding domain-containing protein n=1 Tax=Stachybotrys chlorohalonatus (strain IBT 40285) TaxID=1283841 RepID=A0A084R0F3_STAC4|nr:hypothetical protein S40285_05918 [Stachybotrys chlorohalonata IBT 40285]
MDILTPRWVRYKRDASRQENPGRGSHCPHCHDPLPQPFRLEAWRTHVSNSPASHQALQSDADIVQSFHSLVFGTAATRSQSDNLDTLHPEQAPDPESPSKSGKKRPVPGVPDASEAGGDSLHAEVGDEDATGDGVRRGNKKICSPPSSVDQQRRSDPSNTRSKARLQDRANDFDRGFRNPSGRLWTADDPGPKPPQSRSLQAAPSSHIRHQITHSAKAGRQQLNLQPQDTSLDDAAAQKMFKEPNTRPISQQQLVPEVKGIYAGLVMVESKCIEVDNAQSSNNQQLSNEQWQALIALHRTLLHEHHDFFLASQHPSASSALRRLPHKYSMPARMWRHGIHSFLELLRHKLPESLEHMLSFIYLSYSILALLYETIPAFSETWIECLGDLGRYRMAIEDDDIKDREVWTGVSRHWYTKASDKNPTTGRLYHHLAILSRPNALQQLFFYSKALSVPIPFISARESILTLFDPILGSSATRLQAIDAAFVRIQGILITGKSSELYEPSIDEFYGLLDAQIGRTAKKWLESGYYIGITNCCLLLEYGADSNVLIVAMRQRAEEPDVSMGDSSSQGVESNDPSTPSITFRQALSFFKQTYEIVIRRWGDTNTLPYIHTTLVFIYYMAALPTAMTHLEDHFPWKLTEVMLNLLIKSSKFRPTDGLDFPRQLEDESPRPLPEDFAMRGLLYTEDYFPNDWFSNDKIEEDERYFELASMIEERQERIIWLGRMIEKLGPWLTWNEASQQFTVDAKYDFDFEIDEIPRAQTATRPSRNWHDIIEPEKDP